MNALKHGMAGRGIVLPPGIREEVEERHEALLADLEPKSVVGAIMVRQMAMLSIRMERSGDHEAAEIDRRVRHAVEDFDDARLDEADRLFDAFGESPRLHLRKLLKFPEGVDRLLIAWGELKSDLTREGAPIWTAWHLETAANLCGLRVEEAQGLRICELSKAIEGNPAGAAELRARMVEQIDAEIAWLEAHYETLDFETLEKDRSQAGTRAQFDPSKEATLARRYESEARRGFFKAYQEFQRVEAEAAERAEATPAPAPEPVAAPTPFPAPAPAPLGSFREKPSPAPREPQPNPDRASKSPERPSLDRDGQPLRENPPKSSGG